VPILNLALLETKWITAQDLYWVILAYFANFEWEGVKNPYIFKHLAKTINLFFANIYHAPFDLFLFKKV
jgi:hypothetical protein